jgi:hypothetical protein
MAVFFSNKRIAGYIRIGLKTDVKETQTTWLAFHNNEYSACALGLAIIGKFGLYKGIVAFNEQLLKTDGKVIPAIASILEIDPLLADEINKLHNLDVPAEEISEYLEFEHDNH